MKYKKLLILLAFLFFGTILLIHFLNRNAASNKNQKTINYVLEGKKYKLLVADKPKEWERGLMFIKPQISKISKKPLNLIGVLFKSLRVVYDRTLLVNNINGMVFIFPDKKKRSFWNKNTYLDLDIYWLDNDKVVDKSFLPSVKKSKKIIIVNSDVPVNKVIELIRDNL